MRARADWMNALSDARSRSEEHTSELQSQSNLVCRLLLEKKKKQRRPELESLPHSSPPELPFAHVILGYRLSQLPVPQRVPFPRHLLIITFHRPSLVLSAT